MCSYVASYAAEYTSICMYVTIFSIVVIVVSGQNFHIKKLCDFFYYHTLYWYICTYVRNLHTICFVIVDDSTKRWPSDKYWLLDYKVFVT